MVVTFFAIEAEILKELEAPDRGKLLAEAAQAYRARSQCLAQLGRQPAAQADRKRAEDFETSAAQRPSGAAPRVPGGGGQIQVTNTWTEPVTLVAAGVTYRALVGAQVVIPAPAGSVSYEMQAGPYRSTGTLEAGKAYTIRFPAP